MVDLLLDGVDFGYGFVDLGFGVLVQFGDGVWVFVFGVYGWVDYYLDGVWVFGLVGFGLILFGVVGDWQYWQFGVDCQGGVVVGEFVYLFYWNMCVFWEDQYLGVFFQVFVVLFGQLFEGQFGLVVVDGDGFEQGQGLVEEWYVEQFVFEYLVEWFEEVGEEEGFLGVLVFGEDYVGFFWDVFQFVYFVVDVGDYVGQLDCEVVLVLYYEVVVGVEWQDWCDEEVEGVLDECVGGQQQVKEDGFDGLYC